MLRTVLLSSVIATPAFAAPQVVTDIAPVKSIVDQIMRGIGTTEVILRPGQSPHSAALKPSDARALQDADVVVWIGHGLTPWLEQPVETLAGEAVIIELSDVKGVVTHDTREGHQDHDDHEDGHEHEDQNTDDDEHGHKDVDGHAHDHGDTDPHFWLDPMNGVAWAEAIATELAKVDPENAQTYMANADSLQAELTNIHSDISDQLSGLSNRSYLVYHDAFQYFEKRFDLLHLDSITNSDAEKPSAGHINHLQHDTHDYDVACMIAEPQFQAGVIKAIDNDLKIVEVDPLGAALSGDDMYQQLIKSVGNGFVSCFN